MREKAKRQSWMARLLAATSVACLMTVQLFLVASPARAQTFPGNTISHYVQDSTAATNTTWGTRGTNEATRQKNGTDPSLAAMVMEIGHPWNDGTSYGSTDFCNCTDDHIHFDQIQGWIQRYADDWYANSNSSIHLTLIVSTNTSIATWVDNTDGVHLANTIDNIDNYLMNNGNNANPCGCDETTRVIVVGGMDIEPAWPAGPTPTGGYVGGYRGATTHHFFDTGSADGCSQVAHDNSGCSGNWTQADVLDDSWRTAGTLVFPLPQVYCINNGSACFQQGACNFGSQACQWLEIDLYSINSTTRGAVNMRGAQSTDGTNPPSYLDNTPQQAWSELHNALNSHTSTAQDLNWETDNQFGF